MSRNSGWLCAFFRLKNPSLLFHGIFESREGAGGLGGLEGYQTIGGENDSVSISGDARSIWRLFFG